MPLTKIDHDKQSEYFKYGYAHAINNQDFTPTNGNSYKISEGSYVYEEYKAGWDAGLVDAGRKASS